MTERTTNPEWLEQWQRDYDKAVGRGGRVRDVFARLGKAGGLAIWVEVDESGPAESDRGVVYYSPYLDSMPGDNHRDDPEPDDYCTCPLCEYRLDSGDWLDSMTHATDWGEWDWGDGSDEVLGH